MVNNLSEYIHLSGDPIVFEKYLRIEQRKRSKEFYACADQEVLSKAFNYWLDFDPKLNTENPRLINVNLFSRHLETKIKHRALQIQPMLLENETLNPMLEKELVSITEIILSPITDLKSVFELASDHDDYRFFGSESSRIFFRASFRILQNGSPESSLSREERNFDAKIKYRERFINYWRNVHKS